MKALYFLQYILFMVFFMPLAAMPYGLSVRVGRFMGSLLYMVSAKRRTIAVDNIRRAMDMDAIEYPGSAEQMAREVYKNLGQWFVEMVKVLFGFGQRLVESVQVEGLENIQRASEGGRGIILVASHCGNWELMVLSLTAKVGRTVHAVAKKQNNPYINNFIVNAREKLGTEIIFTEGVLRKFIKLLRGGEVVGMMMDQHVSATMGYMMDFLGTPAWVSRTPATIAAKTGAALIPLVMCLTDKGHVLKFLPEVRVVDDNLEQATAELNMQLQQFIKDNPTQWLWIHRRWKKIPQQTQRTS